MTSTYITVNSANDVYEKTRLTITAISRTCKITLNSTNWENGKQKYIYLRSTSSDYDTFGVTIDATNGESIYTSGNLNNLSIDNAYKFTITKGEGGFFVTLETLTKQ